MLQQFAKRAVVKIAKNNAALQNMTPFCVRFWHCQFGNDFPDDIRQLILESLLPFS